MPLRVFELSCVVIIALTLVAVARRTPWRELLRDYVILALAGWVGEQTSITLYAHYTYAEAWDARVVDVPALVPLIWPLVILSARDVTTHLFPWARGLARAAIVGAVVTFDASLVEVVAVRAQLWSWAEGGHLGVPILGMLGWGFFAMGADLVFERTQGNRRGAAIALAPLVAHALIVVSWWLLFKHALRGELGVASSIGVAAIAALILVAVWRERAAGHAIPLFVAGPRMIAATLFFTLLVLVAPTDRALWAHVVCVALPYVAATRFG